MCHEDLARAAATRTLQPCATRDVAAALEIDRLFPGDPDERTLAGGLRLGSSHDASPLLLSEQEPPYNNAMQLSVRPGTRLAAAAPPHITSKGGRQGARPSRPAADRGR